MTIRETITKLLSQAAPLTLIKQIFPMQNAMQTLSHSAHENKPWINAHEIELTAEDFA